MEVDYVRFYQRGADITDAPPPPPGGAPPPPVELPGGQFVAPRSPPKGSPARPPPPARRPPAPPPGAAPRIAAALRRSPDVAVVHVDGGTTRGDDDCGSLTPHGYAGIEDEVIGRIAAWIDRHGARRK